MNPQVHNRKYSSLQRIKACTWSSILGYDNCPCPSILPLANTLDKQEYKRHLSLYRVFYIHIMFQNLVVILGWPIIREMLLV